METLKKFWKYIAGGLAALASLAAGVAFTQRAKAKKADQIDTKNQVEDAALAERRSMNAGQLLELKRQVAEIPNHSENRSQEAVDEELRRRGLLK